MSTTFATTDNAQHDWYHVHADGEILGRLAVRVARVLMGKNKALFSPNVDTGDFVVVTGVEGLRLSGRKEEQKVYLRHTGFAGGMKRTPFKLMRERKPEELFKLAVRRMLPKNRIGRAMLGKLKVYRGAEHPHSAQQPKPLA